MNVRTRSQHKRERRQRMIRTAKIVSSVVSILVIIGCLLLEQALEAEAVQLDEPEVITEQVQCPEEEAHVQALVVSYPVPLDADLQSFIIQTCEARHIDPAIVLAMIGRESSYDASAIGDNGKAFGLMQIHPQWHSERMEKLNCTDLLDPYQNVIVGIDFLAELLERYDGSMEKALTAYNQGSFKGVVTQYAKAVLSRAGEMKVIEVES